MTSQYDYHDKLDNPRYREAIDRRIKENARIGREKRWLASDPRAEEIINFLNGRSYDAPNSFLGKMEQAYLEYGSLTEGQRSAVINAIEKRAEAKARFDLEKAKSNHIGVVGERQEFEAVVKFTTSYDTMYGTTFVVGMKIGDDTLIFKGTADLVRAQRGDTVRFTARIKEHGERDGEKQTIVQRPTKISINGEPL